MTELAEYHHPLWSGRRMRQSKRRSLCGSIFSAQNLVSAGTFCQRRDRISCRVYSRDPLHRMKLNFSSSTRYPALPHVTARDQAHPRGNRNCSMAARVIALTRALGSGAAAENTTNKQRTRARVPFRVRRWLPLCCALCVSHYSAFTEDHRRKDLWPQGFLIA